MTFWGSNHFGSHFWATRFWAGQDVGGNLPAPPCPEEIVRSKVPPAKEWKPPTNPKRRDDGEALAIALLELL